MKLDRNLNANGRGKYALLKLRKLDEMTDPADPFQNVDHEIVEAIQTLEKAGILDWGNTLESEFFVMRLKDKHAAAALHAYAADADDDDREYGDEVRRLAMRAGRNHPLCKRPD
jgi:hypothetical protein